MSNGGSDTPGYFRTVQEYADWGLKTYGRPAIRRALGGGSVAQHVIDARGALAEFYYGLDETDCDVPTSALDDLSDSLDKALTVLGVAVTNST